MKALTFLLMPFAALAAEGPLPPLPTLAEARTIMKAATAPETPRAMPIDLDRPGLDGPAVSYGCLAIAAGSPEERRARAACASGEALCVRSIAAITDDFCARPSPVSAGPVLLVSGVRRGFGAAHYLLYRRGSRKALEIASAIAGPLDAQ